jgi:hypothetical protein
MMQDVTDKLARLTARLDHMVPDPKLSSAQNQAAATELTSISTKLHTLLPDNSLSPEERLERLARVVASRTPDQTKLVSASTKVAALKARLDQLVPGNMSLEDKIDHLISLATQAVPDPSLSVVKKLEKLGDSAAGIAPVD